MFASEYTKAEVDVWNADNIYAEAAYTLQKHTSNLSFDERQKRRKLIPTQKTISVNYNSLENA